MIRDDVELYEKSRTSLRGKLLAELTEFLILSAYFYICFAALTLLKSAILQAHGIPYAPWVLPAVKAMVCAKFLLLGRTFHKVGGQRNRLIVPTLYRSAAALLVVVAMTAMEEIGIGYFHDRGILASLAGIGGGTAEQFAATCIILFLIFIPLFALRSLGEIVGHHTLFRLFFEQPTVRADK